MSNVSAFQKTGGVNPNRSSFDLSYNKKMDGDMGFLYPVMCDEVVPGDVFTLGNEIVIRCQPLLAPILHEINAYVHYFFVPTRLLDDNFEEFISGGEDGNSDVVLPRWTPSLYGSGKGSLWDYLGFPVGITPTGCLPLSYPRFAYNLIWNEFYRDQNLQTEVLLNNEWILNRAWEKDYFTSALPWQQRGTAPALPVTITGSGSAFFADGAAIYSIGGTTRLYSNDASSAVNLDNTAISTSPLYVKKEDLSANTVDFTDASATTFNVSDLRLAFQIQKWQERNARGGVRYTEFLKAHFGVSPRDERLQRPEYIGGTKSPVIISEVLQTSSTDATTAQGNLAGHGITASQNYAGKYRATEFGYIMGLLSIMPRSAYQQGIDKQWLRNTRYDFYFPEFANLSEQEVLEAEVYATGVESENLTVFGYQGRYNEMRFKRDMVCGNMRDTFDYWHLGRQFATAPSLNSDFIKCNPDKRIFAVPSEPGFIINIENKIQATRPIPICPEPDLLDTY